MLRAIVLTLHDDVGWQVGDANRRIGLVDVLATGAAGAKGIDAQIRRIDIDLDRIIHFRIDENTGKRSMTAITGIERRFAHQAMHAGFTAQITKRVIAADF